MKITEIELHEIHPPYCSWNRGALKLYHGSILDARGIVVLRTDTGLEGVGESIGAIDDTLREELEQLRGTNPCEWLAHPQLQIGLAPAIYDLVGKANGVPAYQLLGPKVRSWVPASYWTVSQTPAKMAEEIQHAVGLGYTWLKYHTSHYNNIIDQTQAMQEVAPRGFKVHYDVNFNNTVEEIVMLAQELARFPIAGLIEDPLRTHDMEGHKVLRQKCVLPIIFHHLPLGGREAMMGLADGYMLGHAPVGQTLRRAGLFEAANVPFMMQNVGGLVTLAFVVHMAAAFDRATLHHVTCSHLWEDDVVSSPLDVVAGQIRVPEAPGLGVTLDREALERLKAAEPIPMPKALVRIAREGGPTSFARPPLSRNPYLTPTDLPGIGEGYNLPVDQDYWHDDGSKEFADLWERTEVGLVSES